MKRSNSLSTFLSVYLSLKIFPSLPKLLCRRTICVLQKLSSLCQKPCKRVALLLTFWLQQELPNLYFCHHLVQCSTPIAYLTPFPSAPGDLSSHLFPLAVCCVNVHQYLLALTPPGVSPLALVGSCCGGIAGLGSRQNQRLPSEAE